MGTKKVSEVCFIRVLCQKFLAFMHLFVDVGQSWTSTIAICERKDWKGSGTSGCLHYKCSFSKENTLSHEDGNVGFFFFPCLIQNQIRSITGTSRAITVFSSSKYPGIPASQQDFVPLFGGRVGELYSEFPLSTIFLSSGQSQVCCVFRLHWTQYV